MTDLSIFEREGNLEEKTGLQLDEVARNILDNEGDVDVGDQERSMFVRCAIKYLNDSPETWDEIKEEFSKGEA